MLTEFLHFFSVVSFMGGLGENRGLSVFIGPYHPKTVRNYLYQLKNCDSSRYTANAWMNAETGENVFIIFYYYFSSWNCCHNFCAGRI